MNSLNFLPLFSSLLIYQSTVMNGFDEIFFLRDRAMRKEKKYKFKLKNSSIRRVDRARERKEIVEHEMRKAREL
jgi:hypothetical protein